MSLDLLVFGPHPDDIEIGLGGTIARHTAAGHRVGLCDLTRGELSSNGTPDERQAEAAAAARVLGAAWRENLGWPDGGIAANAGDRSARRSTSSAVIVRAAIAIPYWDDRHPDHVAASHVLRTAAFRSGLRRYDTGAEPWRPDWICYYFINDSATPSFVVDVSAHYERKREALDCYRSQFAPADDGAVAHAPDRADVPAADRKPRRAVRRARRRRVRRRHRRPRAGRSARVSEARAHEHRHGVLRVGRRQRSRRDRARARARRARPPRPSDQQRAAVPLAQRRARACRSSASTVPPYPLFREPQYLLALANTIARVAEERRLDIVHAHYAVPHATAAYLADQMLDARRTAPAPRRGR